MWAWKKFILSVNSAVTKCIEFRCSNVGLYLFALLCSIFCIFVSREDTRRYAGRRAWANKWRHSSLFSKYFVDLKIQTKPLKPHPRGPNPENKQMCHAWIFTLVSRWHSPHDPRSAAAPSFYCYALNWFWLSFRSEVFLSVDLTFCDKFGRGAISRSEWFFGDFASSYREF
jgi:hypothetical protein